MNMWTSLGRKSVSVGILFCITAYRSWLCYAQNCTISISRNRKRYEIKVCWDTLSTSLQLVGQAETWLKSPKALKTLEEVKWKSVTYGYNGSILIVLWTNMKHPQPPIWASLCIMCIDVANTRKKKKEEEKRAVLCVFVSADLDLIIATTLRQISAN